MTAVERVREALHTLGSVTREHGGGFSAQCPAHDDRMPSLSVRGVEGKVLLNCQAGCRTEDIAATLGLTMSDLFDAPAARGKPVVVAEYPYVDETGELLYVKERRVPKDFRVKRPNGRGGWIWSNVFGGEGAPPRVLYRLPEVLAAAREGRTVYVVEGEKDADALTRLGHVATCNFDGAAKEGQRPKWRPEYGEALRGAQVVIVADRDEPGRAHARAIRADLQAKARSVTVVQAAVEADHADVSDHLAAGHGLDALVPLDDTPAPGPAPQGGEGAPKQERGPSQASQLAKLARERFELFMSDDGRPYARRIDGPNIALPLRGKAGLRSTLARIYADEMGGTVPSQAALADCMTVLEGVAANAEPRVPHLRVARHGECIVVDLGTPDGGCVVIGPDGWRREPRSPVLFRRSGAMKPLPVPVRDGDGLTKLHGLLNASTDGFRLLVAWLVAAFLPDLPHPILTFRGEQGTGKSKAAQVVIGIIDPSGAPKRTAPRDLKGWGVQAFNSWGLCLDNVSTIPDWLSDALCRAVTGDGMVDRALYSDDDVVVLEFRRVLAMTTIDAGALAGDLAERLLMIELNLIPDDRRREEAELDRAYADAHAAILASLFDLLAQVLKALPGVVLTERPRMADFARILAAVDQVQGWQTLDSYRASARNAVADVLEAEPFAQAVVALVDASPEGCVTLTAQEILDRVATPDRLPKKWPKDATRAGGQLKRLAPALRTIGVEVDDTRRGPKPKKQRLYTLTVTPDRRCETASPASPQSPFGAATSENRGDASAPPSASPPTGWGDAGEPQGDADLGAASPHLQGPDLRKDGRGDAGNAGDAEMHLLSNVATSTGPCIRCGQRCQRYGDGGKALCLACRATPAQTGTPA